METDETHETKYSFRATEETSVLSHKFAEYVSLQPPRGEISQPRAQALGKRPGRRGDHPSRAGGRGAGREEEVPSTLTILSPSMRAAECIAGEMQRGTFG